MRPNAQQKGLPLDYFLLVFFFAVPFWLFGRSKLPLPINLPASALGTFVPTMAAAVLCYRREGASGVQRLLSKALDYRKIQNKLWYIPILLLVPFLLFLSYVFMRLTGRPLPDSIQIPFLLAAVFFVVFFIGDAGEELGWSGYATDPLVNQWGVFKAGLILGVIWAVWHLIPWMQTGNRPAWVLSQALNTVALRILIVWFYDKTGKSVFVAILIHDMTNMSEFLFPNYGSHYDPSITALIFWVAALVVTFGSRLGILGQPRNLMASRL